MYSRNIVFHAYSRSVFRGDKYNVRIQHVFHVSPNTYRIHWEDTTPIFGKEQHREETTLYSEFSKSESKPLKVIGHEETPTKEIADWDCD